MNEKVGLELCNSSPTSIWQLTSVIELHQISVTILIFALIINISGGCNLGLDTFRHHSTFTSKKIQKHKDEIFTNSQHSSPASFK